MKITKTRLQQIIREELTRWKSDTAYAVNATGEYIPQGRAGRRRNAAREAELGELPLARRGKRSMTAPRGFDDIDLVDDEDLMNDYLETTGQTSDMDSASSRYTGTTSNRSSRYRGMSDEDMEALDMNESLLRRLKILARARR
jgi:hypothetical protein